jgi:amidase
MPVVLKPAVWPANFFFAAPRCGQSWSMLRPLRERITCLTVRGGLTGVAQVRIPGATVGGLPIGLSIVAGSDASLVAVARALAAQEAADPS